MSDLVKRPVGRRAAACLVMLGINAGCASAGPTDVTPPTLPPPVPAPPGASAPPAPAPMVPTTVPTAPGTPDSGAGAVTPAPAAFAPPVQIPPLPVESVAKAREDAALLTAAMRRDVVGFMHYTPTVQARFIKLARQAIDESHTVIDRPQLVMVVDRNPRVQELCFVLAFPGDTPWQALGGTHVSTGMTARKYDYITPTGVFPNNTDRLGYRAEGTKNQNGIRGIGVKGMRVWDMGWQTAEKGWIPRGETGQIRLEIHATDPQFLAWRLGHPASEGCIRIPATMNTFMDRHGLIDVLYEQAASYDPRFAALLPKGRTPSPIAGDLVAVVDSGPPAQPEIDPWAAKRKLP